MTGSKKFGLALVAILLAAVLYYFATGSDQLSEEMQQRVNTELSTLEQNGFVLKKREKLAKKEHVEISFDKPKKMLTFFKKHGSEMTLEDTEALKGMKVGLDIHYLKDSYSALSVDIYPITLPSVLTETTDMNASNKQLISQLNDILKRKALLLHVDVNKLLSDFKGYAKDINETFILKQPMNLTVKGAIFEGKIKNDQVNALTQEIQNITLTSGSELNVLLKKLKSSYILNTEKIYDSHYQYTTEAVSVHIDNSQNPLDIQIKNISGENTTSVENNLASNKMKLRTSEIMIQDKRNTSKLLDTIFTFNIGNIDMDALKKLETLDINDTEASNKLLQTLIEKGITLEIPAFEVKKMEYRGQSMDGFSLTSSFSINKGTDLAVLQQNPFAILSAINTKTKITLSDKLFALISQQPQAMMIAMLIQPKVVNGKKIYELELKDGKLTVNGSPLM